MSGRLIILPKKSYNPFSAKNIERVLRDERLERERIEKEREEESKQQSDQRISELKKRRPQDDEEEEKGEKKPPGHVNLFEREEREVMDKLVHSGAGAQKSKENEQKKSNEQINYLGGKEAKNRKLGIVPFYLRGKSSALEQTNDDENDTPIEKNNWNKDDRLKRTMDPMKGFITTTDKREERNIPLVPESKHSKRCNDNSSSLDSHGNESDSSSSMHKKSYKRRRKDSRRSRRRRHKKSLSAKEKKKHCSRRTSHEKRRTMEELREKRLQREKYENEREVALCNRSTALGKRKYQNQYFPALSRR